MIKKRFKIIAQYGVHARPATTLVNSCMLYTSDISLSNLKKVVDCKSIMGVMSLGIYSGAIIEISCDGIDEEEAMNAITLKIEELQLGKEI